LHNAVGAERIHDRYNIISEDERPEDDSVCGRVVYLTPELKALLVAQLERVERFSKQTRQIIPYLFPHLTGRRAETQRGDFRKAWTHGL